MYCALRFEAAVVLPNAVAASTASAASCAPVAPPVGRISGSSSTPASVPPVGYGTWLTPVAGHEVAPRATPSQYCVMTPDHSSPLPSCENICCRRGAMPLGSPENVAFGAVPVCVPHCD